MDERATTAIAVVARCGVREELEGAGRAGALREAVLRRVLVVLLVAGRVGQRHTPGRVLGRGVAVDDVGLQRGAVAQLDVGRVATSAVGQRAHTTGNRQAKRAGAVDVVRRDLL